MTINYRVARDFTKYSDSDLDEFANSVVIALTGNASFPAPPVTPTDLGGFNQAFRDAIAAATGAPDKTVAKTNARIALENALRKNANYVETIASQNLEVLLTSGFLPVSTNRAQAPLVAPDIMQLDNLATTQFMMRLKPVTNAKSYQVQTNTNGAGTWQEAGIFTQARRIVLGNLTPGTTYSVRARAIGGATGYSEWSPAQSRMAT